MKRAGIPHTVAKMYNYTYGKKEKFSSGISLKNFNLKTNKPNSFFYREELVACDTHQRRQDSENIPNTNNILIMVQIPTSQISTHHTLLAQGVLTGSN